MKLMVHGAAQIEQCEKRHRDIRHFKDALGWICSACGARTASFTPTWGYYGNIECRKCSRSAIDWVACSEACKAKLLGREGQGA